MSEPAAQARAAAQPTQARRQMQPNSIPSRVASILLNESRRLGRALTVVELWRTYVVRHGHIECRNISTAVAALVDRELVYKAGGRIKHTRYAHVDHPVPFGPDDDVAPHIVAVVVEGVQALKHALSTHEVRKRLIGRGVTVSSVDQLLSRLHSLAHTSAQKAQRAHASWAGAQLRCIEVVTQGGRKALFWAPADSSADAPSRPQAVSDVLRQAVPLAVAAMGRPVARREFAWWTHAMRAAAGVAHRAGVPAEHRAAGRPLATQLQDVQLRPLFNRVGGRDRERSDGVEGLQLVVTPFTGRGACRTRYVAGDPTEDDSAICLAEDLAVMLRPAEETTGIQRLRARAVDSRSAVLHAVADGRERLLGAVLRRFVPDGLDPRAWYATATERACTARLVLGTWIRAAAGAQQLEASEEERLADGAAQLRGLRHAAEHLVAPDGGGGVGTEWLALPDTVGERLSEFAALVSEANAIARRQVRHWTSLLSSARRVRAPVSTVLRSRQADDAHTFVDRVDALLTLSRACRVPALRVTLLDASLVLGVVLRDADVLTDMLTDVTPFDFVARPAVVAALGLLGRVPALEVACPDPASVDDTRAYLAAVGIATAAQAERVRLVDDADRRARGAARLVTDGALRRAEDGARIGIVD